MFAHSKMVSIIIIYCLHTVKLFQALSFIACTLPDGFKRCYQTLIVQLGWDNFGKFIYKFYPKAKTLIMKLKRILIKLYKENVSLLFNKTHTHTFIYIYIYDWLIWHRSCVAWTGGPLVEVRFLHSGVTSSISRGGDHGMHCWWDQIRSKQLSCMSHVGVCRIF